MFTWTFAKTFAKKKFSFAMSEKNFSRDCSLHTQRLTQRKPLSRTFCSTLMYIYIYMYLFTICYDTTWDSEKIRKQSERPKSQKSEQSLRFATAWSTCLLRVYIYIYINAEYMYIWIYLYLLYVMTQASQQRDHQESKQIVKFATRWTTHLLRTRWRPGVARSGVATQESWVRPASRHSRIW